MALFENFPYTNLHELNLDWLIDLLNQITQNQVLSVNGQTGNVILYENAVVQFPNVEEDNWEIIRSTDGTRRGILFGNDDKAYIIHANNMAQVYTTGNQPPYPVTRVNGQTGDIVLYSDAQVRLPALDDAQLHNWNIFRHLNNVSRGIQFDDTGHAYIIDGGNRYKIYDELDTPPYPVTSVNGQTGAVSLFSDSSGNVSFPDYTGAGASSWFIERNINNIPYGIIFNTDGTLTFKVGSDEYGIYTENYLPEGFVEDPEADVLEIINPVESGTVWGLIRSTDEGNVGIIFDNDSQLTEPECYIGYYDQYDQLQRVKLLTAADIPSSSGVVSINGLNGVVVLTGSNINYSSSDSTKLDVKIDTIQGALAYYEAGTNATHNITTGSFVCWKGAAYVANQTISIGDTLSSSNLTALPDGFINKIHDQITTLNDHIGNNKEWNSGNTTLAEVQSYADTLSGTQTGFFYVGYLATASSAAIGLDSDGYFVYLYKASSAREILHFLPIANNRYFRCNKIDNWQSSVTNLATIDTVNLTTKKPGTNTTETKSVMYYNMLTNICEIRFTLDTGAALTAGSSYDVGSLPKYNPLDTTYGFISRANSGGEMGRIDISSSGGLTFRALTNIPTGVELVGTVIYM